MTTFELSYISHNKSPEYSEKEFSEIAIELGKVSVCCASTYSGTHIKNRMMHCAVECCKTS